jgi:zinc protease
MAHLLEHLLFKGTPRIPNIDQEFNQRGVRYNGTTWLDRTNYYELFQASDDNLAWAIELEADRMVNSNIAKKDLDSEMTVVRNEYESGENSPFGVMMKRLQSVAYDWHSYGRSTIGNRSDIENVRIENLQGLLPHLLPARQRGAAGRRKVRREERPSTWVAQHFGPIPKPARALPPEWTVEPTQDGPREFTVRRKGDIQIVRRRLQGALEPARRLRRGRLRQLHPRPCPTGRLHKAWSRPARRRRCSAVPLHGKYTGLQLFGAVLKKDDAVEPVRDEIDPRRGGLRRQPARPPRRWSARGCPFANEVEKDARQP